MSDITIYHNPRCGSSRTALGLIRNSGAEPHIVDYLKTPPDRATLAALAQATGGVRPLLRSKEALYAELGLEDLALSDEALLDALSAHPALLNRPVVSTPLGTRVCRPAETVLEILPAPQQGEFRKENGELLVDASGRRVR
ncbi:MAG TPA: arsenate reductase (glutaredoxin) [Burkholderiaceae bacterium]|jgi:arsenate reductase|nr:arsenate reductase (glutaredoxin) [Burkholderiaceae bacterium]